MDSRAICEIIIKLHSIIYDIEKRKTKKALTQLYDLTFKISDYEIGGKDWEYEDN